MSLYHRLLGSRYDELPPAIQELHDYEGAVAYAGTCGVMRGTSRLANLFADILALPKASEKNDVRVEFKQRPDGKEVWDRYFGHKKFRSIQWQKNGLLYERLNLTTLVFHVHTDAQMLDLQLQQVYVLGLPVARILRPHVIARETMVDGRFHFFIRVTLPGLGLLVQYEGNLEKAC